MAHFENDKEIGPLLSPVVPHNLKIMKNFMVVFLEHIICFKVNKSLAFDKKSKLSDF